MHYSFIFSMALTSNKTYGSIKYIHISKIPIMDYCALVSSNYYFIVCISIIFASLLALSPSLLHYVKISENSAILS